MSKVTRDIIILVVIIAVLAAIFGGIAIYNKYAPQSVKTDDGTNYVVKIPPEEVKSIKFENESGEYTLEKNKEKGFILKEYPDVVLHEIAISNAITSLTSIASLGEVAKMPTDLKQYGLSPQVSRVTITQDNNRQTVMLLGSSIENALYYYFMIEGGKEVYKIGGIAGEAFKLRASDYLKIINTEEKSTQEPSKVLTNFDLIKKNGEKISIEKNPRTDYKMLTMEFLMTAPYYIEVMKDDFVPVIQQMVPLDVIKYVEVESKNLEKYNLVQPDYNVILTYSDGTRYDLKISKVGELVYGIITDKKGVYQITPSLYDKISKLDAFKMSYKYINFINVKNINSAIITGEGKTYTMEISGEEGKEKCKINEKSADIYTFRETYQSVIGISFQSEAKSFKTKNVLYTIKYNLKSGHTWEIPYYDYDERNLAVEKNGRVYLIPKETLTKLIAQLGRFYANPIRN